jgi:hypothetical protein
MLIGYARVSTVDWDQASQRDALKRAGYGAHFRGNGPGAAMPTGRACARSRRRSPPSRKASIQLFNSRASKASLVCSYIEGRWYRREEARSCLR